MIVRTLQQAENTERRVEDPNGNWDSVRLLLKDDNMGFSFHITTIYAGADFQMHYQNHLESVYCMSGEGEVETLDDGMGDNSDGNSTYPISPGTIYILDKHDKHILRAFTEMKMACVFNPPVTGDEVHNADGAYEIITD
jgi:L-ectoine synthase